MCLTDAFARMPRMPFLPVFTALSTAAFTWPFGACFGHAALFGVNPWRLQAWLGHKRIEETMRYVHVAEDHPREQPECVQLAAIGVGDPDRRVIAMLGARGSYVAAAREEKKEVRESALS